MHAPADADELCIIVLAGQARGFWRPCQRAARALDLIGGNLLAVSGSAQHDSQGTWIVDGA